MTALERFRLAIIRASALLAVLLAAGTAGTAGAATWEVVPIEHLIGRAGNPPSPSLIHPLPSFTGDTGEIPLPFCTYTEETQTLACSGTLHLRSQTNPTANGRVFDRYLTDLRIVAGDPAGTGGFLCENAPGTSQAAGFGALVGANICGNYTLGGDFNDNSTLVYDGITVSRVFAGDDVASGLPQSIELYGLSVVQFQGSGGSLVLESADWDANSSFGTQMTFAIGSEAQAGAGDDNFELAMDSEQVLLDVLANDHGFESPVTVSILTAPANGSASVTGSPGAPAAVRIAYTPNPGFSGFDSLVYEVTDGTTTDAAAVTLSVLAPHVPQVYEVTLVEHLIRRVGGEPSAALINPTPSFAGDTGNIPPMSCTYNEANDDLSCEGTLHTRTQVNPTSLGRIFDRFVTDLEIAGAAGSASAYECVDGGFRLAVGASFCGNYVFGDNGLDESALSYGPGTAVVRTMGGDDVAQGDPQSVGDYDLGLVQFTGTGGYLVYESANWSSNQYTGTRIQFAVGDAIGPAGGTALNDGYTVAVNSAGVDLDVLANDIGFGESVAVTLDSLPGNGTAEVMNSPGHPALIRIRYTPTQGFSGTDSFIYRVDDGTYSRNAVVSLSVIVPEAVDDEAVAKNEAATSIDVLANDVGFANPLTVTVTAEPQHGTAVVTGSPGDASGVRIVYTPEAGYTGPDSVVYEVSDGVYSDTATVAIDVVIFKAVDDSVTVVSSSCCHYIEIAANDFGFEDPVTVSLLQGAVYGSSYIYNASGPAANVLLYYNPWGAGNYTETLSYAISDGANTDTATVTINVIEYLAVDDSVTAYGDSPLTIGVTLNDLGFNYPKTLGIFTNPTNGSVEVVPAPSQWGEPTLIYTPAPGFRGVDTFQYAIDDGVRLGVATVTVEVVDDSDGDEVADGVDNCVSVPNPDQRDTDGDGYGNICDADFNNDGVVNFADLAFLRSRFGTSDPDADLDGSGLVNFADLARLQSLFGKPPGPSALAD